MQTKLQRETCLRLAKGRLATLNLTSARQRSTKRKPMHMKLHICCERIKDERHVQIAYGCSESSSSASPEYERLQIDHMIFLSSESLGLNNTRTVPYRNRTNDGSELPIGLIQTTDTDMRHMRPRCARLPSAIAWSSWHHHPHPFCDQGHWGGPMDESPSPLL